MAVNGIELKNGQRWETHIGDIGTLRPTDHATYQWMLDLDDGTNSYSYTNDGLYDTNGRSNRMNLKKLISSVSENTKKYSIDEIETAFSNLGWSVFGRLEEELQRCCDPEYQEYLRLKDKFEK